MWQCRTDLPPRSEQAGRRVHQVRVRCKYVATVAESCSGQLHSQTFCEPRSGFVQKMISQPGYGANCHGRSDRSSESGKLRPVVCGWADSWDSISGTGAFDLSAGAVLSPVDLQVNSFCVEIRVCSFVFYYEAETCVSYWIPKLAVCKRNREV